MRAKGWDSSFECVALKDKNFGDVFILLILPKKTFVVWNCLETTQEFESTQWIIFFMINTTFAAYFFIRKSCFFHN